MPQGLEIYRDGAATPYFDLIAGYILGSQALSLGAGGSGSISDGNLANGTPFYFVQQSDYTKNLTVTLTSSSVSYSAPDGFTGMLFWGVR